MAEGNLEVTNLIRAELGMRPWTSGMMQMFSMGDLVKERTAPFMDNGVVIDSPAHQAESKRILDQNGPAMERPWKEEDFPEMAEVLHRNAASLKVLTEGVKRPKYYRPMVKRNPEETLVSILLPDVQVAREFARQLAMRAMLHLGHGLVQEAKDDLLTMHRHAALISHGATLIEGLVGIAIDSIAAAGDNRWANHPQVTATDIAAYRAQLQTLPAVSNFSDQLDHAERYMGLDVTQAIARGRVTTSTLFPETKLINSSSTPGESDGDIFAEWIRPDQLIEGIIGLSVDWNTAMTTLNSQYELLVAAANSPNAQARDKALAAMEVVLKAQQA